MKFGTPETFVADDNTVWLKMKWEPSLDVSQNLKYQITYAEQGDNHAEVWLDSFSWFFRKCSTLGKFLPLARVDWSVGREGSYNSCSFINDSWWWHLVKNILFQSSVSVKHLSEWIFMTSFGQNCCMIKLSIKRFLLHRFFWRNKNNWTNEGKLSDCMVQGWKFLWSF